MSPDSSSGTSFSSVGSTTPAGTISQIARGLASFCTKSSSDAAPVEPCFSDAATAAAEVSNTTQWCPAFCSRTTMLAPIRPNPTIPSSIMSLFI
jgi:hypothetical protein